MLTSPDGITWSLGYSGTHLSLYGVGYVNGAFIAVGESGTIRLSSGGTAWRPLTITPDLAFSATAYGNGHYVAVGSYPFTNHPAIGTAAVYSTDGIDYALGSTAPFIGAGAGFKDVVFGNGQFVAVGTNAIIQTSPDGKQWVTRYSSLSESLYSIAYGGGQFVAVGPGGLVLRSSNGQNWVAGSSGPAANHKGITYANGQFVAVGAQGSISTSTDGGMWTARTSGTAVDLSSVIYGNGIYVAVGAGGTLIRSTNSIDWTSGAAFTNDAIHDVTFANGQFVTVGENGEIFTSPNGTNWTKRLTGTDGFNLNGIGYANGLFVAVGDGAMLLTAPDDGNNPPPPPPPAGDFAITGVTAVNCAVVSATQRSLSFTPTYAGTNGQPITFAVANEMVATTNPGPYTLTMYTDNPAITLRATQSGTAGEVSYTYNWLATCDNNPPPPPPPAGDFAITGVTSVNCTAISATKRSLSFTPSYSGTNGQPVTFAVANEMVPTTNPGPYTLSMYTDNPAITLRATQSGTAGEVSYTYNWLAVCNNANARLGAVEETELAVRVLGNPVGPTVTVEVTGAEGKVLSLSLVDMAGRVVARHDTDQAQQIARFAIDVSAQPVGTLLLRVSTATKTKIVRILKNE